MPKTPEIKQKFLVCQKIEQSKPKPVLSAKFSKEEIEFLEWVTKRDNDKILQSMSWREQK